MSLSPKLDWPLANPKWASEINPFLANPLNSVSILTDVQLKVGANVINHLLGHKQSGWFLVDIQGPATIYRSAAFNDLTLQLTSSAAVVASIGVF